MGQATSATLLSTALPTLAFTVGMNIQIVARERVSLGTLSFTGVLCRHGFATQDIFAIRYGLKMGIIHTEACAAQVIDGKAIGNEANPVFIGPTVGAHHSPIASESPIPVGVSTHPQPAAARHSIRERPVFIDFGQESGRIIHVFIIPHTGLRRPSAVSPALIGS